MTLRYYICGNGIPVSETFYNLCGLAEIEDVLLDELVLCAMEDGLI